MVQFLAEIMFYETTECVLMNFIIPDLVRAEVQSVGYSLRQTLQNMCSGSIDSSSQSILDAPSYLFIST